MWINIPVPWIPWVLLIVNGNYALDLTDLVSVFCIKSITSNRIGGMLSQETSLFTIPFRGFRRKERSTTRFMKNIEEFLSNKILFSTSSSEKSDNNKITLPVASSFLLNGPYVKSWGSFPPLASMVQPNLENAQGTLEMESL